MVMPLILRDLLPSPQPDIGRIYGDQPSLLLPHASFNAAVKFWINDIFALRLLGQSYIGLTLLEPDWVAFD